MNKRLLTILLWQSLILVFIASLTLLTNKFVGGVALFAMGGATILAILIPEIRDNTLGAVCDEMEDEDSEEKPNSDSTT